MNLDKKHYSRALTIAGFDPSGGAGIQADLKTFSALSCYGMSVLTALPVQNTTGVKSIFDIPPSCVAEQLEAVLEDIGADAIKLGMLHKPEIIEIICSILKNYPHIPIILDPVMFAKSGHRLLDESFSSHFKKDLFPLTTIITPNLPEASVLLKRPICSQSEMENAAREICSLGPKITVIKGGHLLSEHSDDCVCIHDQIHWLHAQRIETLNTHGTGCTYSAAITALMAKKVDPLSAIKQAKEFIHNAIKSGADYSIGQGYGPVHHFYKYWN